MTTNIPQVSKSGPIKCHAAYLELVDLSYNHFQMRPIYLLVSIRPQYESKWTVHALEPALKQACPIAFPIFSC